MTRPDYNNFSSLHDSLDIILSKNKKILALTDLI
ncbi:hypothetical protein MNBD_GAMMA07-2353 [hydrothermal vent metagenome]|uniref:Uncharacterized protein n=1 Tax=hydrothermal vent metagenome TaxID=652676 RepID=A0A3B0X451_9ZZZZ